MKMKFSARLVAALSVSLLGMGVASANPSFTDNNGFYYTFSKGHSVLHVKCGELPSIAGNWNTGIRVAPTIDGTVQVEGTCASDGLAFGGPNNLNSTSNSYPGGYTANGTTVAPDTDNHTVPSSFKVSQTESTLITIRDNNGGALGIYGLPIGADTSNTFIGDMTSEETDPTGSLLKTSTLEIPGTNPFHMSITNSDPNAFVTHLAGINDCQIAVGEHVYATKQIKVVTSGDFVFRAVATTPLNRDIHNHGSVSSGLGDAYLAVYKEFDPSDPDSTDPSKQAIGCNDDGFAGVGATSTGYLVAGNMPKFSAHLDAGIYTLVATTFGSSGTDWAAAETNWASTVAEGGIDGKESITFELWGTGSFEAEASSTPDTPSTCSKSVGTAYFKANSSSLTKATKKSLKKWAKSVKSSGCSAISLKGYTATTTNYSKSQKDARVKLAKARNAAVAKFLKAEFKTLGADITIKKQSFGAADPVASNKKAAKRWKNRRVEIILAAS